MGYSGGTESPMFSWFLGNAQKHRMLLGVRKTAHGILSLLPRTLSRYHFHHSHPEESTVLHRWGCFRSLIEKQLITSSSSEPYNSLRGHLLTNRLRILSTKWQRRKSYFVHLHFVIVDGFLSFAFESKSVHEHCSVKQHAPVYSSQIIPPTSLEVSTHRTLLTR